MIDINKHQAVFYDQIFLADNAFLGYSKNRKANIITRLWAGLRYKQQESIKKSGVREFIDQKHAEWIQRKNGGKFLEIGCFSGSRMTIKLCELSSFYTGVELSTKAVDALNKTFQEKSLNEKAKAICGDFLDWDTTNKYDLFFVHGVLHHFQNLLPVLQKIKDMSSPGAFLILQEPSECFWFFRALRTLYRPFQSDAAWEWPFNFRSIAILNSFCSPLEGFGWGYRSLLLSLLTGFPVFSGFFTSLYEKTVKREVQQGWTKNVWKNSIVTGLFEIKL